MVQTSARSGTKQIGAGRSPEQGTESVWTGDRRSRKPRIGCRRCRLESPASRWSRHLESADLHLESADLQIVGTGDLNGAVSRPGRPSELVEGSGTPPTSDSN